MQKASAFTKAVRSGLIAFVGLCLFIMVIALLDRNNYDEASIGTFDADDFNDGWNLTYKGETMEDVSLPMYVNAESGEEVVISNTLPVNLSDGMNLMVRASMEDVCVYIDGKLRDEYSSQSVRHMGYYIPSAYIVTSVNSEDAGKKIDIHITIKTRGSINAIKLGYGNNGWFEVMNEGLPVSFIAFFALITGAVIILASLILGRKYKAIAAGYLGILVMDVTMWMFSESILRQLIFSRPSLSQYFSYITLELIGALACMYFDEVQHRIYHRRYLVLETVTLILVATNTVLHITGIKEFYETLTFCHVLEGICALVIIFNIINDIRTDRIHTYRVSMIGGIIFIILSMIELSTFYLSRFVIFGSYVCIGLIGLMAATVVQTAVDVIGEFKENEKRRIAMMNNTIETIAGAIDARDEYTGGHSERVGTYARLLAKEMMESGEYDLTEEDVLRIHYIGLVHDIGKIGVADGILNKAGKLTTEEYSLMKRHTEIGYELMSSMGDEIRGALDGIRYHHERYDGTGYPDGLAGEDIPLVARVLCLADSYDAMTSNRVYRKRLTNEEVRNELLRCSGTQFDPKLTEIFIRLLVAGKLRESTVEGMAANEKGVVTISSMLESRLQDDLLEGTKILHASHVRMICYIIKLMEKKGREYSVIIAGPSDEVLAGNELTSYTRKLTHIILQNIGNHDLMVRYTDRTSIVALFERSSEETDAFVAKLGNDFPDISVEIL